LISYLKNIILTAIILALITTNLLTLLYQPFTTVLSSVIGTAFGIATVTSILETALNARDLKLDQQQKIIASKDQQMKMDNQKMLQRKSAIKRFGKSVTLRTKQLIKKTLAAIPAESIPVIGTAVVVGGAAYEIYVACENLKDIQQLQQEFEVGESTENGIMETICQQLTR
jgi:hypothetical protein